MEVEAKSLNSSRLPAILVVDENQRRLRDYMAITQGKNTFTAKKTFVVNTNSSLIQQIEKLETKQPELAKDLAKSVYDMARLSQKELESSDVESVVKRQTETLEKLAALIP